MRNATRHPYRTVTRIIGCEFFSMLYREKAMILVHVVGTLVWQRKTPFSKYKETRGLTAIKLRLPQPADK